MCLTNDTWRPHRGWDGKTVYKLVECFARGDGSREIIPDAGFLTACRLARIFIGGVQQDTTHPLSRLPYEGPDGTGLDGATYPRGIHCFISRAGARAWRNLAKLRRALILQGEILGTVVSKGSQDGHPCVVVDKVLWKRICR